MRTRFKPSPEQRSDLRAQLARAQTPPVALQLVHPVLPQGFVPSEVQVTTERVHPDRFVLRVEARSADSASRTFALKGYADDFVERVWAYSRALALVHRPNHRGLSLPIHYSAPDRLLISEWVPGEFLSDVLDDRKPDLLRQAALLVADVHRLPLVPERLTTPEMIVAEAIARCDRLRTKWPETSSLIEPMMDELQQAAACLEPAEPAPVHGDLSPGQFVWTGERLVLFDLDSFGYTDPAYDVGHFLAQVERRSIVDFTVRPLTRAWLSHFEDAYLEAMPRVSRRNIAFYRGLTLVAKMYTIRRREPTYWEGPLSLLATHAHTVFEEVITAAECAR
ncbi:MAG TPA: phosphotransferase [Gemmatimonadales bacterium]|nr:phosphotransferase [Gemmatimonadales bacterium]